MHSGAGCGLFDLSKTFLAPSSGPIEEKSIMTAAATKQKPAAASAAAPVKARELMEELNADAGKLNIWVRTELNAPAQRAWFADTGGGSGAGQLAKGRVAANQIKTLPCRWRWKDYGPFLERIEAI